VVLLGLFYILFAKTFTEFASIGIGVHHAGVSIEDRRATEQLYLKKLLRVLVATSVWTHSFLHFVQVCVHNILSRLWLSVSTCVSSKDFSQLIFKDLSSGAHGRHQGCSNVPEWQKPRIFRSRYYADAGSCGRAHSLSANSKF